MSDIQSNRKVRVVEFSLVIFVALAPLIFRSTFILLTGRHTDKADSFDALYFGGIISQVSTPMIPTITEAIVLARIRPRRYAACWRRNSASGMFSPIQPAPNTCP